METPGGGRKAEPAGEAEHLSRPEAIAQLRARLRTLTDEEHCMCTAAARLGVYCRGFARLSDEDFRRRFWWIVRTRPGATRPELERIVSLYHLGRQEVTGTELCCDVETRERTGCDGWNTFDNAMLERFFLELVGRPVSIG
ncbi:MAG: hypothetical protein ACRD3M_15905 [Thermoanaerobaculia bacterium]